MPLTDQITEIAPHERTEFLSYHLISKAYLKFISAPLYFSLHVRMFRVLPSNKSTMHDIDITGHSYKNYQNV